MFWFSLCKRKKGQWGSSFVTNVSREWGIIFPGKAELAVNQHVPGILKHRIKEKIKSIENREEGSQVRVRQNNGPGASRS